MNFLCRLAKLVGYRANLPNMLVGNLQNLGLILLQSKQ